jgi:hypothetical protein
LKDGDLMPEGNDLSLLRMASVRYIEGESITNGS